MKIAALQVNPTVGHGQNDWLRHEIDQVAFADVILLPELVTTGYPPRDLLLRSDFIDQNLVLRDRLVEHTRHITGVLVFGFVDRVAGDGRKPLANAVCVAAAGQVIQVRHKTLLPTYDVFDEHRYFEPGSFLPGNLTPFLWQGRKFGVLDCEEVWNSSEFWKSHLYPNDPVQHMVQNGAEYLLVLNASPYRLGVPEVRRAMMRHHCTRFGVGCTYVNQVGGNDEILFDGNSFALDERGDVLQQAAPFAPDRMVVDTQARAIREARLDVAEEVFLALRLGIQDYFRKNRIQGPAVIGLSGGIDSAVTAVLAVEALGKARVIGITMPSEFSSAGSVTDAEALARRLGICFTEAPIKGEHAASQAADGPMMDSFHQAGFGPVEADVSDENVQARIRGRKLMKVANRLGGVVLATGNKSEMAVGYCTLYGDMCGGLAVISDVPKTLVYRLAGWINRKEEIIPTSTIDKRPSAELRHDQFDDQVLPPYDTLDAIVELYVDKMESIESIVRILDVRGENGRRYKDQHGRDLEQDVRWTCNKIDRNEFKRRQAPIGLKVTTRHFGYGWDMPVAQSYTKEPC